MFSDTHCHFSHVASRGLSVATLISDMLEDKYRLAMDIGTIPGDFAERRSLIQDACKGEIPSFISFSCGIWPQAKSIKNQAKSLQLLEADIKAMLGRLSTSSENDATTPLCFAALGECGLDRYWNGTGKKHDEDNEDGPGTDDLDGEEALFSQQLDMAHKYNLPVIVHSREAFEPTYSIVKNQNAQNGVIHCFSYEIPEARAFLDQGWYISFPGNITWGKKPVQNERIQSLLSFVPKDRLLLETDAPYLTPAPHRGKINTPWHVRFIYEKAAEFLGMETAALAELVFVNAEKLFGVTTK
ncbi:MAG TPA: TatD family hydrolase [Treponema sp.]|nr:TatD family hydrolase [Treponema sp.]